MNKGFISGVTQGTGPISNTGQTPRTRQAVFGRPAVLLSLQATAGNRAVVKALSRDQSATIVQRSVGLEFECTNLPITSVVKEEDETATATADKNETIISGDYWKMVYEKTSEGQPVVEFVTWPPAETQKQLTQSTAKMADRAKGIKSKGKKGKTFTNNGKIFTVKMEGGGEVDAAVQVTMGVPTGDIPRMLESSEDVGTPRPSLQKLRQLQKEDVKVPGGEKFSDLEPESQGFVLLLIDYIKKGYLPPAMRAKEPSYQGLKKRAKEQKQKEWKKSGRPFVKGLYDFMIRTDMTGIFQSLPKDQQDRFTELVEEEDEKRRAMRQEWIDWLLDKSIEKPDRSLGKGKGDIDLSDDRLISHKISGRKGPTVGPKKGDWLRALPEKDLLTEEGFMGIGKMEKKTDVVSDTKEKAPVFEHREPYGSNKVVGDWKNVAKEQWARYASIVQGKDVVMGKEQ